MNTCANHSIVSALDVNRVKTFNSGMSVAMDPAARTHDTDIAKNEILMQVGHMPTCFKSNERQIVETLILI